MSLIILDAQHRTVHVIACLNGTPMEDVLEEFFAAQDTSANHCQWMEWEGNIQIQA